MISATAVRILPMQSQNKAWLSFQRQAMSAIETQDYESAQRYLSAAFRLTSGMRTRDPRPLITLESLSEVSEKLEDYQTAGRWLNMLITRIWFDIGPSALIVKQMRRMCKLKLKLDRPEDAKYYSILATTLSLEIDSQAKEAQAQTIAPRSGLRPILPPIKPISAIAVAS